MARKLRAWDPSDGLMLEIGIKSLRKARAAFEAMGAKRTSARVNAALSSALGAKRHAERIRLRHQEQKAKEAT